MCGIYGEVALSAGAPVGAYAEVALDQLSHRGPDDRGLWAGDGVVLGACRLSIIDVAGGHQPIWNEDRSLAIVFNGELYNFLDLRPGLEARGHAFATRTDTEVLLHAYEEWGRACLDRLNGMFAFAIWDERTRTLVLARDRLGEKPLYYVADGQRLVFASEIKGILADPTVRREVDPRGLTNFLTFGHSVAPATMFRRVSKLLPGHGLEVREGRMSTFRYWDVPGEPEASPGHPVEGDILDLLDDSVRRRLVSDVPLGAFLSGGLDSTAVVALMKRHSSGPVRTFSLGFEGGAAYDELPAARRVADWLGTEHHEVRAKPAELVSAMSRLVYHYDEPFGDPTAFPLFLLSRFARQHVTVALSGDGGDELFGGYRRYAADLLAGPYQRLPQALTGSMIPTAVGRLPRLRRVKQAVEALRIPDPARRYGAWLQVFGPDLQQRLLSPELRAELRDHDPFARHRGCYEAFPGHDHLNRLMYVDVKTLLPDAYLEKTDKATMACSLEGRLPFLDHRLVELAFSIPGDQKVQGWQTKRILKRALRGVVPEWVVRRRKHGFTVPTDPWFRGELRSFGFEVLLDGRTRRRGYVDPAVVERLWREHASGRHSWDAHLWLLVNLELWQRTYMDREAA